MGRAHETATPCGFLDHRFQKSFARNRVILGLFHVSSPLCCFGRSPIKIGKNLHLTGRLLELRHFPVDATDGDPE
jgi:hypothetical protein